MLLGGVLIESTFGLDGHSDADILLHAITDALLGALALGDIGSHFPDTDPRWKGAESMQFVVHALELVREQGYEVVNLDTTVILEKPKLKDYRTKIRERIASNLGIDVGAVSVKFKTAEKVGPVGQGMSAEAQALVLLRRAV